jgi:hypothetical protein
LDMFYQKYARSSPAGMTYDEFDALMQTVKKHLKSLGLEVHPQVLPGQDWVREVYNMPRCMYSVAALIVISFGCNILEKEIDPSGEQYKSVWEGLDTTFNILFLFELLVNMYGYGGPRPAFWRSAWNVFDTIVVAVGCVLMTGAELGAFNKLKLMRAFRVFRLFKRIESLNQSAHPLHAHTLPRTRAAVPAAAPAAPSAANRSAPPLGASWCLSTAIARHQHGARALAPCLTTVPWLCPTRVQSSRRSCAASRACSTRA